MSTIKHTGKYVEDMKIHEGRILIQSYFKKAIKDADQTAIDYIDANLSKWGELANDDIRAIIVDMRYSIYGYYIDSVGSRLIHNTDETFQFMEVTKKLNLTSKIKCELSGGWTSEFFRYNVLYFINNSGNIVASPYAGPYTNEMLITIVPNKYGLFVEHAVTPKDERTAKAMVDRFNELIKDDDIYADLQKHLKETFNMSYDRAEDCIYEFKS